MAIQQKLDNEDYYRKFIFLIKLEVISANDEFSSKFHASLNLQIVSDLQAISFGRTKVK